MTAHAVREALRGGPSREAQLRTLADEARSQLWGFFQVGCSTARMRVVTCKLWESADTTTASVAALTAASWTCLSTCLTKHAQLSVLHQTRSLTHLVNSNKRQPTHSALARATWRTIALLSG